MEIELKYAIPEDEICEKIWFDEDLGNILEKDSCIVEHMHGAYYDTKDMTLQQNDITFRIRQEGDSAVACLKWKGTNKGALHMREELNITLGPEIPDEPDVEIFKESEMYEKLRDIIRDDPVDKIIGVDVLRKSMRVDTGNSLIEISIDTGSVRANGRETPIREVELELFQGNEEDLMILGEELMEKYDLAVETESKYARGLKLLRG